MCHACDGPGVPLGGLGAVFWNRCRNCGMVFSEKPVDWLVESDEDNEPEEMR